MVITGTIVAIIRAAASEFDVEAVGAAGWGPDRPRAVAVEGALALLFPSQSRRSSEGGGSEMIHLPAS